MAVGASEPTVVATKDGRIGMKSQMQVSFLRAVLGTWKILGKGKKMLRKKEAYFPSYFP